MSSDALGDRHGGEEGVGDAEGHGGEEVAHHHHEEEGEGGGGGEGVANQPGESPFPAFASNRLDLHTTGVLLLSIRAGLIGGWEHGGSKDGGAKTQGGETLQSTAPSPSGDKSIGSSVFPSLCFGFEWPFYIQMCLMSSP